MSLSMQIEAFAAQNLTSFTVAQKELIFSAIDLLNQGKIRAAEKVGSTWQVNTWVKQAILLYFRTQENQLYSDHCTQFYDKIPLKFANFTKDDFKESGARVVPPAYVRTGAYIAPKVVLMPSFVNIGAYVGEGTMVDTWATVGSCAQIGKHVHISGGVGIGGVLEPLQAQPTIIEDNVFIGARSEIVEGVMVREGSVISMGVYIGQSTRIYHRQKKQILFGEVPPGSVVIPGSLPAEDGSRSIACAVIVKEVDDVTRSKVSINQLLRESV